MKRFNVNLPEGTYEKLRKESFDTHKSMSQIVVETLGYGEKALVEESQEKTVAGKFKNRGELDADNYTD